jgi:hypothetical protein
MLSPAREGTRNVLEAAEKDWNPTTWQEACKSDNPSYVYCASKKFAEETAWEFIKEKKPSFDIATMCKYVPNASQWIYQDK